MQDVSRGRGRGICCGCFLRFQEGRFTVLLCFLFSLAAIHIRSGKMQDVSRGRAGICCGCFLGFQEDKFAVLLCFFYNFLHSFSGSECAWSDVASATLKEEEVKEVLVVLLIEVQRRKCNCKIGKGEGGVGCCNCC